MDEALIAAAFAGVILLAGRRVTLSNKPRGIRNNNAGNIREKTGDLWDGQSGSDGDGFAVFVAPEWGIRALAKLLGNYERLYGLNTVEGIISRYAPDSENNTAAYISSVSKSLGIDADTSFSVESKLMELIEAIIRHENGMQPYGRELIAVGIKMAEGYEYA